MAEKPRSFSPAPTDTALDQDPGADPRQLELELDLDPLEADGAHQGLGHRADKAPSDREHGKKTRQRFKDIVSGRR
jgi:hypothetical protein